MRRFTPRPAPAVGALVVVLFLGAVVPGLAAPAPSGPGSASPSAPATADAESANASADGEARIVELYPNPTTAENRGEYLVVHLPAAGNWSLADGHHVARLPRNASGTVAFSMHPEAARELLATSPSDAAVRPLGDYFPLAADGDRIELRRNGTAVDTVAYGRVQEGHRWRAGWERWRPAGFEPRDPTRIDGATVTPFVLPDTPGPPVAPLATAEDRLLVAGYTIESERVADRLVAAARRGVTVRVLVEGSPVGGFPVQGARVADRLVDAGVEVRVLDGEPARFRFHHAKYAVADDRAVVLTENWKPTGTGGESSRGWGVVAADPAVADDLAGLFDDDATGPGTRSWAAFRADAEFHGDPESNWTDDETAYPTRFDPPSPTAADVEVLTAPGNAADRLVARIDAADERVLAVVPRTGGPNERLVRALRRAADRGVDVHLLLSDAWYDYERNRKLVDALADEPISVALAEPRGRYGKVHAKGLVVDDTAVVGSLNWNEGAATENREVLLAVESAAVADFYARAYAADWRGGGVHLPVGTVAGLAATLIGAGLVARREVRFV